MTILNKKKHFELFRKECEYWVNKFNLNDWRVAYRFDDDYDTWDVDARAVIKVDPEMSTRIAVIWLNMEWNSEELNEFNLREAAFHEVLELRLWSFRKMAEMPFPIGRIMIDKEVHIIIRILEGLLFIDDLKKRKIKIAKEIK